MRNQQRLAAERGLSGRCRARTKLRSKWTRESASIYQVLIATSSKRHISGA